MRFFTAFTGGGLADVGFMNAGMTGVGGLEIDPEIAYAGNRNLGAGHVRVDDMVTADPAGYPFAEWGHFSPPCITASIANSSAEVNKAGTKESDLDIALARGIIRFIKHHQYPVVSLENVYGYRKYQSFKGGHDCEGIVPALRRLGYAVGWWHVNSADYGVPQTRQRLIMVAKWVGRPTLPQTTHYNPDGRKMTAGFVGNWFLKPWVGWYEAIEDLLPSLPLAYKRKGAACDWDPNGLECRQSPFCRGHFADWQLKRLGNNGAFEYDFLLNTNTSGSDVGVRAGGMPAFTSRPNDCGRLNAFVVNGAPNSHGKTVTVCSDSTPMFTVTASIGVKRVARALLLGAGTRSTPISPMPADTLTANRNQMTIRAWLQRGVVVAMTPRAVARFQSVPDWYVLPAKKHLAFKIIGNGVPCLLMEEVARANKD